MNSLVLALFYASRNQRGKEEKEELKASKIRHANVCPFWSLKNVILSRYLYVFAFFVLQSIVCGNTYRWQAHYAFFKWTVETLGLCWLEKRRSSQSSVFAWVSCISDLSYIWNMTAPHSWQAIIRRNRHEEAKVLESSHFFIEMRAKLTKDLRGRARKRKLLIAWLLLPPPPRRALSLSGTCASIDTCREHERRAGFGAFLSFLPTLQAAFLWMAHWWQGW